MNVSGEKEHKRKKKKRREISNPILPNRMLTFQNVIINIIMIDPNSPKKKISQ